MADDPLNPNQPPPPAVDPPAAPPPPDGQGNKPDDSPQGKADTPPADKPEGDKKFTQADVDRIVKDRLTREVKKELKNELKKLTGEGEGQPTLEDLKTENATLKTQGTEKDNELRRYRARDQVDDFVSDKRNQVSVRNMKALIRYVEHDFEYDDQGKVTNLKDLVTKAKLEVPELFGGSSSSIDAGNGSRQTSAMDMNAWMRGR